MGENSEQRDSELGFMILLSSDPHSCLGVFHCRGPPWASSRNLRPSLPLSSCPLPFLCPIFLLGGTLMTQGERGSCVEMAGIVGIVGHRIAQSPPVGWEAEVSQRAFTPRPLCQALRGSVWLPCILVIPQPLAGWLGGGRRYLRGARRSPMQKRDGESQWAELCLTGKGSLGPTCQARPGSSQEGNLCSDRCSDGVGSPEASIYHN